MIASTAVFVRVGYGIVAAGALVLWRAKKVDGFDAFLQVVVGGAVVVALLLWREWLGLIAIALWGAYVAWQVKPTGSSSRPDEDETTR